MIVLAARRLHQTTAPHRRPGTRPAEDGRGRQVLHRHRHPGRRRNQGAATRALQSVALGLLEEYLGHCVAGAIAEGGDTPTAKVKEASDAIACLVKIRTTPAAGGLHIRAAQAR